MQYKCMVCNNIMSRMPEYCPNCDTKNSYLPTNETSPSSEKKGLFTKEQWEKKVK